MSKFNYTVIPLLLRNTPTYFLVLPLILLGVVQIATFLDLLYSRLIVPDYFQALTTRSPTPTLLCSHLRIFAPQLFILRPSQAFYLVEHRSLLLRWSAPQHSVTDTPHQCFGLARLHPRSICRTKRLLSSLRRSHTDGNLPEVSGTRQVSETELIRSLILSASSASSTSQLSSPRRAGHVVMAPTLARADLGTS